MRLDKSFLSIVFVLFIGAAALAVAANAKEESVVEYAHGGSGKLEYPWSGEGARGFAVWQPTSGFSATFTDKTKLRVLGRPEITLKTFDLLSGRQVVVVGTFVQHGKGEGTWSECTELIVALVPEEK